MLSVINAVQCLENPDFLMWYNACMLRAFFFKTTVSFWNINGEALPLNRKKRAKATWSLWNFRAAPQNTMQSTGLF